jgi:hypothetical protein
VISGVELTRSAGEEMAGESPPGPSSADRLSRLPGGSLRAGCRLISVQPLSQTVLGGAFGNDQGLNWSSRVIRF